jgi:hypothetical protein
MSELKPLDFYTLTRILHPGVQQYNENKQEDLFDETQDMWDWEIQSTEVTNLENDDMVDYAVSDSLFEHKLLSAGSQVERNDYINQLLISPEAERLVLLFLKGFGGRVDVNVSDNNNIKSLMNNGCSEQEWTLWAPLVDILCDTQAFHLSIFFLSPNMSASNYILQIEVNGILWCATESCRSRLTTRMANQTSTQAWIAYELLAIACTASTTKRMVQA